MYYRVLRVKMKPDSIEEAIKIVEESTIPFLRDKKGWKDFEILFDNETDEAIVLVRWASKEDIIAATEDESAAEQSGDFSHFMSEEPTIKLMEQLRYYSK
jgi:heme-degrading monooxygenase HmoA